MATQNKTTDPDFDDPIRSIGPDATAGFNSTLSDSTEHASSEALVPDAEEDTEAQAVASDEDDSRDDEEAGEDEEVLDAEDIEVDEDETDADEMDEDDAAEEGTED